VPASVLAAYQSVNQKADTTANTPFQTYGGEFVAPINQQQSAGVAGTNAAANEAQPYFGAATGDIQSTQANTQPINDAATGLAAASAGPVNAQQIGSQQIDQFMNPYLNTVLGSTAGLLNQNNQQQQAGQLGTAIESGAFGGDRTGLAAANLEQQQNLANANIYSGIASGAFNTALGAAQQQQGVNLGAGQANRAALASAGQELAGIGQTAYGEGANTATTLAGLGAGAQTAGLQGAQAQIGAGTLEQQTAQAQDTAQYNQFLQQQSYPFQVDSWLASIAEGTGALSGSTTTTSQPGGFFSDVRLKHDIKQIGKTFDGQEIYSYKMHGDDRTHIGLIAQKVEKKHPEAVGLAGGYKIVDYGAATEKAANRGHFYSGGVVPIRRKAYADGGMPYDYLSAQQQMYAPMESRQNRNIPNQAPAAHQLAVASGSPTPVPTGASNLNQSLGLINNGRTLYNRFSSPSSTPSTPTPAGAWSDPATSGGFDGSAGYSGGLAPAAAPAAETAAPAAAEAAAPAAAEAAVPVAADAAVGAGAETAAALAAEYAAADVGAAALIAAKRGGRMKRPGLDAGGMPYQGDGAGTPYQSADGTMDIPNDPNTAKLQTAGPLKKQPTGLQTALSMGDPNSLGTTVGSMFSNTALSRGGLARRRRGYDDGGDVSDSDMPELTVEGQRPDPVTYAGGVNPEPIKVDSGAEPPMPGLKGGLPPDSPPASTDHWWKHAENVVPILQGLAAMGTAPTKHLGVALAAGLGAGAQSWLPAQQQEADIQRTQLQNQMARMQVGAMRGAMTPPSGGGSQATIPGAPPSDASALPGYFAKKYNPTMTPAELSRYNSAQVAGGYTKNPGLAQSVMTDYQQRVARQQQDAIQQHDQAYSVATAQDGNFAALAKSDPVAAAAISKSLGFDAASNQIPPSADEAAKQYATAKVTAIHPWTGSDYKDEGGSFRDTRTGKPAIGATAQTLTAEQTQQNWQRAVAEANEPVTTGAGLPTLRYKSLGYPSDTAYAAHKTGTPAPQSAATPPQAAPPVKPPATSTPTKTVAHAPATPSSPQTQMLNGVDLNAIPKLPPLPAVVDQPTKARADERATSDVKVQNDTMGSLSQQAAAAARNTAVYSQLEKTLANASPREFGPSSSTYKAVMGLKTYLSGLPPDGLVNQAEADKYLAQLGVGGSKQLLGADQQLRQQEMLLLMSRANPNIDQPLQVIKNLAAFGRVGNEYDFKAANTGVAAIRNGADPFAVPGAIESQMPRAAYVTGKLNTPQSHLDYLKAHPETASQFKAKHGYLP
jgi:hypothetical protein